MAKIVTGRSKNAKEINYMMEQSLFSHRIGIVQELREPYLHPNIMSSSAEIYRYIQDRDLYTVSSVKYEESFFVIAMNKGNKVIGHTCLSIGDTSSCLASTKKAMQFLLMVNASSFVCVHNHPSGRLTPSQPDIDLTRKMKEVGKLLDFLLIDHVIVIPNERNDNMVLGNYYSFADQGMITSL